ncbi:GNAT family N-acetyltransferase [Lentzea sp. NPDC058436]|uniref:GNAT family N-acetyltransferase n=1 Tax=Lentzea sp. NPDC058436 TaxID=3346499 RepID=UPI003656A6A3
MLAAHRNRGVGTTLLDTAVAHARDRGCARIVLSPSERSVSFYERAGFGPATMLLAHVLEV